MLDSFWDKHIWLYVYVTVECINLYTHLFLVYQMEIVRTCMWNYAIVIPESIKYIRYAY